MARSRFVRQLRLRCRSGGQPRSWGGCGPIGGGTSISASACRLRVCHGLARRWACALPHLCTPTAWPQLFAPIVSRPKMLIASPDRRNRTHLCVSEVGRLSASACKGECWLNGAAGDTAGSCARERGNAVAVDRRCISVRRPPGRPPAAPWLANPFNRPDSTQCRFCVHILIHSPYLIGVNADEMSNAVASRH